MTTFEESKYPDDIMNLELTDEIKSIEIVSNFMSSFNSKSESKLEEEGIV